MSAVSDVVFTNCAEELLFLKDKNNIDIDSVEIKNDGISQLYEIEIKLSHKNDKANDSNKFAIKEDKMEVLFGKSLQFYFKSKPSKDESASGKEIYKNFYSGIITDVSLCSLPNMNNYYQYKITIRPAIWLLTQNFHDRAWLEKDTDEIIESIFKAYPDYIYFSKKDNINRNGQDLQYKRVRTNTIQYKESDYDFLCRLLQEEGLSYIIEHEQSEINTKDDLKSYQKLKLVYDTNSYFDNKYKKIKNEKEGGLIKVSPYSFNYKHTAKLSNYKLTTNFIDQRKHLENFEQSNSVDKKPIFNLLSKSNINNSKLKDSVNTLNDYLTNSHKVELQRIKTVSDLVTGSNFTKTLRLGQQIQFEARKSKNEILNNSEIHYIFNLNHKYVRQEGGYSLEFMAYPTKTLYMHDYKPLNGGMSQNLIAYIYGDENGNIKEILGNEKEGAINPGNLIAISFPFQKFAAKDVLDKHQLSAYSWARVEKLVASNGSESRFPVEAGNEAKISFLNGDINQPVFEGVFLNSKNKAAKPIANKETAKLHGFFYLSNEKSEKMFAVENLSDNNSYSQSLLQKDNIKNTVMNKEDKKNAALELNGLGNATVATTQDVSVTSEKGNISTDAKEGNISTKTEKGNISTEAKGDISTEAKGNIKTDSKGDISTKASGNINAKATKVNINKVTVN